MKIEHFWKTLQDFGVAVPGDVQRQVGLALNQEKVLIRPPTTASTKVRVMEYGTSVPATFVARKLGVTVQHVRRVRRIVGG